MDKLNRNKFERTGLLTAILGGLAVGIPALPLTAQTLPNCPPKQVYEPQSQRVPARPTSNTGTTPIREYDRPVARVTPSNGRVDVMLKNNTNAVVRYQALGYTDYLPLAGGEEKLLRNIPLPATIAFARQDNGFVEVIPVTATNGQGMFVVNLDEDRQPLDSNQGVLRIQEDGSVFLN